MVDVGLIERQQIRPFAPIGDIRVVLRDVELHDEGVAVGMEVGEVDVEQAIVLEIRVEGESEHALLQVVTLDKHAQVEERVGQEIAILVDDPDAADALDHEEPAAAVIGRRDVDRVGQAIGNLDELDGRVARERPARLDGALTRTAALGLIRRRGRGAGVASWAAAWRSAPKPPPPRTANTITTVRNDLIRNMVVPFAKPRLLFGTGRFVAFRYAREEAGRSLRHHRRRAAVGSARGSAGASHGGLPSRNPGERELESR